MPSIFEVVEKFLKSPANIEEVFQADKEFYFRYAGHCFSVLRRSQDLQKYGDYSLYVYPKWTGALHDLYEAFTMAGDVEPVMVTYHVKENPEIREPLIKLFKLLEEKNLKIDKIFKDVLNS